MVKPTVEKSPNAVSEVTRPRRSCSSGTEKAALSAPMPSAVWRI